jgi:hypothetical protein
MSRTPPVATAGPDSFSPKPVKPPVLAKWVIIPVIGIVAVEIIYGWPAAKANASNANFALPHLMGRLIGSILISLILAWFFYRIFRKSTRAGSIAFTLVAVLVCFAEMRNLQTHFEFPDVGIEVDLPPEWFHIRPDGPETISRWISPGSLAVSGHVHGLIVVESIPVVPGGDAAMFAQNLADKSGGQVSNENDTLGGERAWRIGINSHAQDLEPVEALVVLHNKRIFVLTLQEMPDYSYHDQFDFVRDHWKWMPVSQ